MSLSELWPQLASLHSDIGADIATDIRNGSPVEASTEANTSESSTMICKVLYASRRQPLLVPLNILQARRAIKFFIRNPLLRYWGNLLLTLDRWMPRKQLLPTVRLEQFPHRELFANSNMEGMAMFCGFPGPLQKLTIYCPNINSGLGKVAKIALHHSANKAISQEAYWLNKLNQSPPIEKFLPRLLEQGTLTCGRQYFTMLSLPQGVSPKKFGKPHFEFLRVLAQQKPTFGHWQYSQAYIRLYERTQALLPMVDRDLRTLWLDALAEVQQQIGQVELPACMIHGDFAPWNLRQMDTELLVFDWEYAEASGNPLQDFLHFHLIPLALNRWSLRPKTMAALITKTATYAESQFGNEAIFEVSVGKNIAAARGALTIHYLLDTMTFYVAATGYMDYTHPVLSTYLTLLQERSQWLPEKSISALKNQNLQHCR